MTRLLLLLLAAYGLVLVGCMATQRKLLYYPTHRTLRNALEPWVVDGQIIGYARVVPAPRTVWLLLHGNGGQAGDRVYALPSFAPTDSVYVLEYPGYGLRAGAPSRPSIDAAARSAYRELRARFPGLPVCVAGESIGSGPACMLSQETPAPDTIALIVPFDTLARVAADHFRFLPVSWILRDKWDNIAALSGYRGPVEIFGAESDTIIPIRHARALAESIPGATFHAIAGGHNDWPANGAVRFHHP